MKPSKEQTRVWKQKGALALCLATLSLAAVACGFDGTAADESSDITGLTIPLIFEQDGVTYRLDGVFDVTGRLADHRHCRRPGCPGLRVIAEETPVTKESEQCELRV